MNSIVPNEKILDTKGQTTLFQANIGKPYIVVPKMIRLNEVTLQRWRLQDATLPQPIQNREPSRINQYEDGDVEIQFSNDRMARLSVGSKLSVDSVTHQDPFFF